jgi:hypothetical protein
MFGKLLNRVVFLQGLNDVSFGRTPFSMSFSNKQKRLPKLSLCALPPESKLPPPKYTGNPQKLQKETPERRQSRGNNPSRSIFQTEQCSPTDHPTKSPLFIGGATQITPSKALSQHSRNSQSKKKKKIKNQKSLIPS